MKRLFKKTLVALIVFLFFPAVLSYAADGKKIRVGVAKSMPPFAFFDPKLKAIRGFCVDLALMAGKLMKTKVELYGYDDAQLIAALRSGQIDIVSCALLQPKPDSDYQLIDTGIQVERHLFANKSCLTVTCLKDLSRHRVAVEKGRSLEHVDFLSSEITVVEASSPEEALGILNAGGADVYISPNSLSTMYLIQKLRFQNIKQVGIPFETGSLSLAVLKERAELLTELSLALGKIQQGDHYRALRQKWLGRHIEINVWESYIKYILMALAGLATVLLVFAAWNVMLKRKVEQVTEDLVLSGKKYRELIESSPDMIHIISTDGQIQMTNRRSREIFGYSEQESVGMNLADLVVPDQKEDMRYFMLSLFENGYGENEFTFHTGSDIRIPVEMVATTLRDGGQSGGMASCFSRDMRVRKSLEEELIRSERLAIMGQMSAGLAHEINNPLGIILGHAQDLLGGPLDDETRRESLEVIANNAVRAGRIVNGLLSFSRQSQPLKHPVELLDIIEASLLFVKSEIRSKKVSLSKDLPENPMIISGDENQLQQVFVNLFLNAIHALNEKGEIIIRVRGEKSNAGREAVVEIQDNGHGIRASDIHKVFQPFYTTKEGGFGLGLFISSIIVERHGGTIRAESEEGRGTKITLSLPLSEEPHQIKAGS